MSGPTTANPSPKATLRNLVAGRRILWLDAHPENNEREMGFLGSERGRDVFLTARSLAEAKGHLTAAQGNIDLVISHWGENEPDKDGEKSVALGLLRWIHEKDVRAPVIVYAWATTAKGRRSEALKAGAFAIVGEPARLFREIERLFGV